MITDVTIQYANEITHKNEITNFPMLGLNAENISAVSWALRKTNRANGTVRLISEMINRLSSENDNKFIDMYIQLSGSQPDTPLIRYKKIWGLLKSRGFKVDFMSHKLDTIISSSEGLTLSGMSRFPVSSLKQMAPFIANERKIFFAFLSSENFVENSDYLQSEKEWMSLIWSKNGVVFMPLGALDEIDCEVVALGKSSSINILR